MEFLDAKAREEVEKQFRELKENVQLVYFSQKIDCLYCDETGQLLKEVADLSEKIELIEYNFQVNRDKADEFGITMVPGLLIKRKEEDYGIKFYGIPSGYEFTSLLHSIKMVSNGEHDLKSGVLERISKIKDKVHIQVFVTPTCPYCPAAVVNAHKLAFVSDKITADMIEASEFPDLSMKFGVNGVPKTVINNELSFTGAYPVNDLLGEIEKAVK